MAIQEMCLWIWRYLPDSPLEDKSQTKAEGACSDAVIESGVRFEVRQQLGNVREHVTERDAHGVSAVPIMHFHAVDGRVAGVFIEIVGRTKEFRREAVAEVGFAAEARILRDIVDFSL